MYRLTFLATFRTKIQMIGRFTHQYFSILTRNGDHLPLIGLQQFKVVNVITLIIKYGYLALRLWTVLLSIFCIYASHSWIVWETMYFARSR